MALMGEFDGQVEDRILMGYTLWLFNVAMENGPVIDGLSIYSRYTGILVM